MLASVVVTPTSAQQPQKSNIVIIMADGIGYWNISAYNRGYYTPNIDCIANEGAIFTDYYGQQSCTAGPAAFVTGQIALLPVGVKARGSDDKSLTYFPHVEGSVSG